VAVYFNCQTTIINDIKQRYADKFTCKDNRVLLLPVKQPVPAEELSECMNIALKYHVNKKARKAGLM